MPKAERFTKMERNKLHLLHIRDALNKIEEYTGGLDYDKFAECDLEFDAIMMQIIVIGEAVNCLSDEFREKYSDQPWHRAVGMRNQTAHGYIGIKPDIVWDTIKNDFPILEKNIMEILKQY